jgi:DNA anti-recombination protein RmuC
MKKIFIIACTAAFLGTAATVSAQDQDSTGYTKDKATEKEMEQATDQVEQQWDQSKDKAQDQAKDANDQIKESADKAAESTEDAVDETGKDLQKAGKTGAAEIKDEKIESKVGPDGEPVFIDEHAQYYYIDKNGQRVNVDKSELKDKA